jgi:hypothetical protein
MRSSLTEFMQAQVVSCMTTFDLRSTLQETFSSTSRARLTDLKRQLQTAKKGSASCSEFLQQLLRLADEYLRRRPGAGGS